MSALLEPFSSTNQDSSELNVLAAAVDGLQPLQPFGDIPHGFSFYHGAQDVTLPNLWQGSPLKPQRDSKLQAAITFNLNTLNQTSSVTACTLPLANTIFHNGLQSTLLASRWRRSGTHLELDHITEKQTQEVNFSPEFAASKTTIEAPLVPITAPRKILAGLGNIIRQIEVDGKPTPASKELETAVQALYDRRMKEGHEFPPGPVGVWAVVIPPAATQVSDLERLQEWSNRLRKDSTAEDEWKQTLDTKRFVQGFLGHGARVYRILSGGGGWGKKQGLLSLDPETKYSSSDEDDLDSFIRSFSSQLDGAIQGGVVAPGSYVQYFVSPPATAKPELPSGKGSFTSVSFGVSENALAEDLPLAEGPSNWTIVPDHFGAVTSHGLFIASGASKSGEPTESKLDAPDSWIGYSNMASNGISPSKIGVISIGDMGVGIAKLLIAKGFQVATNCKGRSEDTIQRARDAKVELIDSDFDLASQCAAILSVVPPRDAEATAQRIIDALDGTSRSVPLYFVDMNAVAPSTCKSIADLFSRSRVPAVFIDACIIGAPPRPRSAPNAGTNLSSSAPQTDDNDDWSVPGMPMSGPHNLADFPISSGETESLGARLSAVLGGKHISPEIGAASGLKMCFASMSKGFTAIATQAFTTASRIGVLDHLREELSTRLPAYLQFAEKGVVTMPPKAYRWVREMEEISKTHAEEGGFGPELFLGAAGVYKAVEESPLGAEKIGKRKRGTTVDDVAAAIIEGFERKKKKTE
ncbi:uncharacterized protein CTRU02_205593 [Colletotrichum truncatum]|uniref:Uncharacterized protein n=1 Tax=Colletotrichum truncatum TaxID=5467 RepID=A0ACC3Z4H4_COLTU